MTQKSIQSVASQSEQTPFEVLKTKVYPVINDVILKLIDQIVKSEQVQKHEQRLKKKKVVDELQRKYLERDIEKQEMGSDYEESDDEEYHRMLGMNKETVDKLVRGRIAKHKENPTAVDDDIDPNAFDPIEFIILELKKIHNGQQVV